MTATRRRRFFLAMLAIAFLAAVLIGNSLVKPTLRRIERTGRILNSDLQQLSLPDLPWTWTPNLHGYFHPLWHVRISTNEQGFRTGPFTPKNERRRIVILGDSIMFGVRLPEEETLAGLLARDTDYEVFNLGIPIYQLPEKMASYNHFGKALAPDLVLLQTKPGDFFSREPMRISTWERKIPLLLWLHYRLYRKSKPEKDGVKPFWRWQQQLRASGTPMLVVFYPILITKFRDEIQQSDLTSLRDMQLPIIDVGELLSSEGRSPYQYRIESDDVIHPNAQAQAMVAKAVQAELANLTPPGE